MLLSLLRRLAGGHGQRADRFGAAPRRFVPGFTALEDRSLPSGVPLQETLTVVGVSPTGVVHYEGQASHFGHNVEQSQFSILSDFSLDSVSTGLYHPAYLSLTTAASTA